MTTSTYTVVRMTYGHCASSVREEVSEVAGASHVEVGLESGRLAVTGESFDDEAVRAAVDETGHELAFDLVAGMEPASATIEPATRWTG